MATPSSGIIKFSDIRTEFSLPLGKISFSSLYRGGTYLKNNKAVERSEIGVIPTSGTIRVSSFRGKSRYKTYTFSIDSGTWNGLSIDNCISSQSSSFNFTSSPDAPGTLVLNTPLYVEMNIKSGVVLNGVKVDLLCGQQPDRQKSTAPGLRLFTGENAVSNKCISYVVNRGTINGFAATNQGNSYLGGHAIVYGRDSYLENYGSIIYGNGFSSPGKAIKHQDVYSPIIGNFTLVNEGSIAGLRELTVGEISEGICTSPLPPQITISLSPSSVISGNSTTLSWNVTGDVYPGTISINNGIGSVGTSGSRTIGTGSTGTFTYTLTATGPGGTSTQSAVLTVSPVPLPQISFSASPTSITTGNPTTLSWNVTGNVTSVSIDNGVGNVANSGSRSVTPSSAGTTTYTLTATGPGGSVSQSVNITVTDPPEPLPPPPQISFSVSPSSVQVGNSATLSWTVTGKITSINIDNGIGAVSSSGTRNVTPSSTGTFTYTLTANGPGGTSSQSVSLTVTNTPPPQPPSISFSVSPASIIVGQSATLSWSVSNATSISISNGIGTVSSSGTRSVSPASAGNYAYTLTATGPGGTSTQSVNLAVSPCVPDTINSNGTTYTSATILYNSGYTETFYAFTSTSDFRPFPRDSGYTYGNIIATINDFYKNALGRVGDKEGIEFWTNEYATNPNSYPNLSYINTAIRNSYFTDGEYNKVATNGGRKRIYDKCGNNFYSTSGL